MNIELDDVRIERDGRCVLDIPELHIRSSSITAILGPNGAGKTTLLRVIAGLQRPTAGRVLVAGKPPQPGRMVGFLFQQTVFVQGSVKANLDLALRLRKVDRAERDTRIREALALLGVEHLSERAASGISVGEARRVSLARTLALRQPVVLLDEPFAGMDKPTASRLTADLRAILARAGATTTVIVGHHEDAASAVADHTIELDAGRLC